MEPPATYKAVAPPDAAITGRIHYIRGQKVMLDRDLAELYGVQVKALKQAVRRNMERFPEDFMFTIRGGGPLQPAPRSPNATLKRGQNIKYVPFAFTEHGILMLANVLRSEQAIAVSIHIIRVFNRMREVFHSPENVLDKLRELEERISVHDNEIQAIFDHLTELVSPTEQARKPIGFKPAEA
ncbi:MAG: ORF6N domain-containing protein [Flavobacteriales bacterium]|nr:ORF6N domain-containing protein [Flavobacteriales bacterium]